MRVNGQRGAEQLRAAGVDIALLREATRRGSPLPPALFARRHRSLVLLLQVHVVLLPLLGLLGGRLDPLAAAYVVAMAALAGLADWPRPGRGGRAGCATLGLVTASAAVVHLAHGYIEAHVHFFVVIVLVALYQEWRPFALAVAFVTLHHGVLGTLFPTDVYNHPDAWAYPWKWAAIHAGLVVGVGMVGLLSTRLHEANAVALRHAAESFASTFDAAGEALAIRDGATVVAANQAYAELVGRPAAAIVGRPIFGLLTSASSAEAWARVRAGDERPFEAAVVRADGSTVPVELAGKAIRFRGRPARLVALRDISARAEARAALATSEANLAEAQRVARLGSWVFDYEARTLRYSDEAFRIGGYAPQSWVPTPERLLAAVHPADRARVAGFLERARAGDAPPELDYRLVRPDGTVRDVFQRAELLRDGAGRPAKLVGTVQDVTAQRALEARLARQATHDDLTGLPNRAFLLDRLGRALGDGRAEAGAPAVLFLDLDRFKDVNDSRGHDAGDRLLVAVADRLRGAFGARDTLARLGGDEFAILLAGVGGAGEAARAAERLLAALGAPFVLDGQAYAATASVGIVIADGGYDRPGDVLRDADVAMYRAKAAGRAGYALFDPAMQAALTDRLALERDLAGAAGRGELRVHYQPKVDLTSGRTTYVEALVRWTHPARGLVPPGDFIPLAEETGLIVPLGRWVLGEACRQVVAWGEATPGAAVPALAVNLSPRQFRDPGLVADVAAHLAATGLPATRLMLEVTESVAMERVAETIATLRALKALGVGLALDDFGTGHSSLAYLRQLPLDTLKIDRSFFREGPANRAIVGAVTDLAHGLGLAVTAEGLETADQVAWARAAGCDRGQGFFFARPLPPAEIAALWAAGLAFDLPGSGRAALARPASRLAPARA